MKVELKHMRRVVWIFPLLILACFPANADSLPNTIEITADVSFTYVPINTTLTEATQTFHASYQLQNIASQPLFLTGNPFQDPIGGDYTLVPNSMSLSTSGPLGPFALVLSEPNANVFNFSDSLGNRIEFFWLEQNVWKIPGTYFGSNVELRLSPTVSTTGETFGQGTVVVTGVPEPVTTTLLVAGLLAFLCAIPSWKWRKV
jgi:hypothetical protein